MLSLFRSLAGGRRGAHAIEYTLVAAILAIAGVSAMNAMAAKATHLMSAGVSAL